MDYITRELINFNIEQQKNNPYVDSLVYPNQDAAEFYAKASMETWLMSCEDGSIDYNYIPSIKEQSYARLLARNIGAKNVISVYGSSFAAISYLSTAFSALVNIPLLPMVKLIATLASISNTIMVTTNAISVIPCTCFFILLIFKIILR